MVADSHCPSVFYNEDEIDYKMSMKHSPQYASDALLYGGSDRRVPSPHAWDPGFSDTSFNSPHGGFAERRGLTLDRGRRGPWRDAGFWLRIISPSGTKHIRRRGQSTSDLRQTAGGHAFTLPRKLSSHKSPNPVKPLGTPTKHHGSGMIGSPIKTLPSLSSLEEDCEDSGFCSGVWDGSPQTPVNRGLPPAFDRHASQCRTLPRTFSPGGAAPGGVPPSPGGGWLSPRGLFSPRGSPLMSSLGPATKDSPWWWRVLSPRKVLPELPEPMVQPDLMTEQWVDGSDKKWQRSVSLRRQYNRSRHHGNHMQDPGAHSDTELSKLSETHSSLLDGESVGGSLSSDRAIGRVSVWATSFEKLLEDQAGLHTFAEFLKKEFSHENIYFWTACERYKRISDPEERRIKAKDIFDRHLGPGASEPVNVDSQARQVAQDGLQKPDEFTFAQVQKQIFNLMKFDSYSRFLKSALYKEAEICDMRGHTLPYPGNETLDPDLRIVHEDSHTKLKKSKSDADERRRKSLLPWHRKDRSRSKDRGEAEYRRRKKLGQRNTSDSSSIRSDISESRTSLNSDLANGRRAVSRESLTSGEVGSLSGSEGSNRCRVILPDLSASVVAVRTGETCQSLLNRLLERRGISYSTFDLYLLKGDKMLDKLEDSSVLGGQEVRIEQRILFRLDFPNRKTVCVKAKPHKNTSDVLKPILAKYGYKLELMAIHKIGEDKSINLKTQVNELDGQRLVVQTKEEVKEWGVEPGRIKKRTNTLDEITNRVFNEVLEGKTDNFDELGVLDIDEKDKLRSSGSRSSLHENITVRGGFVMPPDPSALVTKRRGSTSSNTTKSKQENDELYEGLKRAQRSRLDDQRGTEINFELPDFLKCDQQSQERESGLSHLSEQFLSHLECSFSEGGVIPSHQEAEDYFSCAHPEVWGDLPLSAPAAPLSANATLLAPPEEIDDLDDTILGGEALCQVALEADITPQPQPNSVDPHTTNNNNNRVAAPGPPPSPLIMSPPPLPPKPKLGACARGPPPRPPSRQLHLITPHTNFSSNSDDEHVQSEHMPHLPRQTHDNFNISFV
ncbi:unnamed protein product [Meganyctiphanes norvegica]|uniref:Regulator of G-protein signaling 12 n=1 Tax=Meganyctiphanes norvegica TaxID=48144 RepID=A0AAV2R5F4_MEGNR